MNKSPHKKGFTLIEIVGVLLLTLVLAAWAMKVEANKTQKDKINEMYETIYLVINNAIYSPAKGYASDKGGVCSSNYDVVNISAARVKDCAGLQIETVRGSDDTDGEDSYFIFLKEFSAEEGCKVYIDDESVFATAIFLDCSTLKGNIQGRVEQGLTSYLRSKNPLAFKSVSTEALNLTTTTGGTVSDGLVKIVIEE